MTIKDDQCVQLLQPRVGGCTTVFPYAACFTLSCTVLCCAAPSPFAHTPALQAVSAHPQWFQVHTGNATTISLSKIMQDRMHHHNVMDPHMPKVLHHTMQDTLQRTQQALMAIVGILALEPNKAVSYKNLRHQVLRAGWGCILFRIDLRMSLKKEFRAK